GVDVREHTALGRVLPADRLAQCRRVDGNHHQRRLVAEQALGDACHLVTGRAVDEAGTAVEWRTVEPAGALELRPLARQQNLVDPHVARLSTGAYSGLVSPVVSASGRER